MVVPIRESQVAFDGGKAFEQPLISITAVSTGLHLQSGGMAWRIPCSPAIVHVLQATVCRRVIAILVDYVPKNWSAAQSQSLAPRQATAADQEAESLVNSRLATISTHSDPGS